MTPFWMVKSSCHIHMQNINNETLLKRLKFGRVERSLVLIEDRRQVPLCGPCSRGQADIWQQNWHRHFFSLCLKQNNYVDRKDLQTKRPGCGFSRDLLHAQFVRNLCAIHKKDTNSSGPVRYRLGRGLEWSAQKNPWQAANRQVVSQSHYVIHHKARGRAMLAHVYNFFTKKK